MGSIDVPFEIVVVCRRSDVLLHPGGYRLTARAIKEQRGRQRWAAGPEIRAIVHRRAVVDPLIRPRPTIKFLVEADGADTFWMARRQLLFSSAGLAHVAPGVRLAGAARFQQGNVVMGSARNVTMGSASPRAR